MSDLNSEAKQQSSLPAEIVSQQDVYFAKVVDLFQEKDNHEWARVNNDQMFSLWRTQPAGTNVNMQKVKLTMKASF